MLDLADLLNQRVAGHDLAGILRQDAQHIHDARLKREGLAIARPAIALRLDHDLANPQGA
ncbi:MAG: hypothetical protein WA989_12290 [Henriciella sp.]|uniref:hypothetical protein n=1 Tax=Henriciella sp. TaxID=1968823 RepID=UPI003C77DE27